MAELLTNHEMTLRLVLPNAPTIRVAQTQEDLLFEHPGAESAEELLSRAYPGDAGFDLFCREEHWIGPGESVDIPLGVRVQLPEGWWGLLTGRSSTLRKRGLLVAQGVIDQGYRGPLYAYVRNMTEEMVRVRDGERLAQLIPLPLFSGTIELVEDLEDHERGVNGFGSSGT